MEIETTLKLTDALRAATMRRAQDFLGEVPEILSGHDGNGKPLKSSHAAFIALPFVSDFQEHADGHVLGVGVVLPRSIHPNQRRQLIRALAGLNHLTVPGVGKLGLCRIPTEEDGPRNLRPFVWNRPSRQWASATPVLLDRFPKRNGRGIADIIARSCEYIGLPPPVDVSVNRYSPLIGVEPSSRFITRRPAGALPNRLRAHVTLRFEQPVKGPVLLGAGRYFGLGLMRPLMEEPTCP